MRVLLLLALLATLPSLARAQPDARPDIVLFLADDLGVGDLGCYGQTRMQTPHVDALAREGVLARRAYAAAPVCAPSRCAILTGQHTGHCSVDHNDEPNVPLGLSDPTVAELLQRHGYRTGIVGKWGLGGETDHAEPFGLASLPTELGFEHVFSVLDQELAQDHFPDRIFTTECFRAIEGNAEGGRAHFDDDLFVEDALAFVDAAATDPRPFFLFFTSTLPHRELDPPTLDHEDSGWPDAERAYATMVERFDTDVGRIVERLDALARDRRTLVIVASDNGPVGLEGHDAHFFDSTAGLRGEKRDLYEGGLRVPLVVRWRGALDTRTIDAPVALYDLLPTLTEVAGIAAPTPIDGVSIVPWLRGERMDAVHTRLFFSVREAHGGTEPTTRFALREGPLTLVERADGAAELYDVDVDPRQAHDLAAERASDVARMRADRLAESTGPIRRSVPMLGLSGEGVPEPSLAYEPWARVLDLVVSSRSDALEVRSSAPLARAPSIEAEGGHAEVVEDEVGEALVLGTGEHVTIGAHPALAFGDASFTLEARVRLAHVEASPIATRDRRRYLALSKPEASRDELLDWGLLVQAGDVALAASPDASGHELAMLFADPEIGGHGTWAIATRTLTIADEAWHDVVFRFDAEVRRATFSVDGRTETIDVDDLGHVRSDGPLVIGAHQDVHGAWDSFLDGTIASLRLTRGALDDAALGQPESPRDEPDCRIDLGTVQVGAPELVRTLDVLNRAPAPAIAMDVELAVTGDERVSAALADLQGIAERTPLTIRVRTDRPGRFAATLTLSASATHYAYALRGARRITITGEVLARPAPPSPGLPLVPILLAIGLVTIGIRFALARRRAR